MDHSPIYYGVHDHYIIIILFYSISTTIQHTTYNCLYSYLCSHNNTSLLHAACWICLRLLTPITWEFFGLMYGVVLLVCIDSRGSISDQSYQWRHAVYTHTHTHMPSVSRGDWRAQTTNQNTFQLLPLTSCGLVPSQGRRMRERWGWWRIWQVKMDCLTARYSSYTEYRSEECKLVSCGV